MKVVSYGVVVSDTITKFLMLHGNNILSPHKNNNIYGFVSEYLFASNECLVHLWLLNIYGEHKCERKGGEKGLSHIFLGKQGSADTLLNVMHKKVSTDDLLFWVTFCQP